MPSATTDKISLTAAALARTTLVPEVAVKSEFANLIPLTYTSINPASYAIVAELLSEPLNVV